MTSSRIPYIASVIPNDWNSLMRFSRDVQKYLSSLGKSDQTIYLSDLYLTGSTVSRLLATDASQKVVSTDLASWVAGTTNQITRTDDGDGTITLSTPQNIHTGASPTFVTAKLTGLTDSYIPYHVNDATGLADSNITYASDDITITLADVGQFIVDARTTPNEATGAMYIKYTAPATKDESRALYISAINSQTVGTGTEYISAGEYIYSGNTQAVTSGDLVYGGLHVAVRKTGTSTTSDYLSSYGVFVDNLHLGTAVDAETDVYGFYGAVIVGSDVGTTSYGIKTYASGAGTNWAGYFEVGDVWVGDTLYTDDIVSTGLITSVGLTVDTTTLYVDTSNHRVGVGTITPSLKLDVKGAANTSFTNCPLLMQVHTTDVYADNMGGGISLGGMYDDTHSTTFGYVAGLKDGAGDGDVGGKLILGARATGGGAADMTVVTIYGTGITTTKDLYPATDNTYYLGKNDDDTPFAWKGLILKDQAGTGIYYRLEIVDDALVITDLSD
jgi:hypothetical protein